MKESFAMSIPKIRVRNAIDEQVGSRLRMRRMMLGMSQEKLGEAFGLTFQQVQKYEKGLNRMSASRLQHAAEILGVSVPFFFEGAPGGHIEGGDTPLPAYVDDFVSSEDGQRLIKAFMRIPRSAVRHRIVDVVQEIASGRFRLNPASHGAAAMPPTDPTATIHQ
jgi:transcriptional regulator with XRE-family HTH domain